MIRHIAIAFALTALPALAVQKSDGLQADKPADCRALAGGLQRRACQTCLKRADHRYISRGVTGLCEQNQRDENGNIIDRAGSAIGEGVDDAGKAAGRAGTAIDRELNKAGNKIGNAIEKRREKKPKPAEEE